MNGARLGAKLRMGQFLHELDYWLLREQAATTKLAARAACGLACEVLSFLKAATQTE